MNRLDWRDEILFDIHSKVEQHGFSVQYVMGTGPDPSWGYTIGLLAHGHPEVIVFGLDPESTSGGLHALFEEIREGTFRPVGRDVDQALDELPVRLLPVPGEHWDRAGDRLCIAVEYYRSLGWDRSKLQAVQLVWATPSGHFPWDAECSASFRRLQPLLDPGVETA